MFDKPCPLTDKSCVHPQMIMMIIFWPGDPLELFSKVGELYIVVPALQGASCGP